MVTRDDYLGAVIACVQELARDGYVACNVRGDVGGLILFDVQTEADLDRIRRVGQIKAGYLESAQFAYSLELVERTSHPSADARIFVVTQRPGPDAEMAAKSRERYLRAFGNYQAALRAEGFEIDGVTVDPRGLLTWGVGMARSPEERARLDTIYEEQFKEAELAHVRVAFGRDRAEAEATPDPSGQG